MKFVREKNTLFFCHCKEQKQGEIWPFIVEADYMSALIRVREEPRFLRLHSQCQQGKKATL